MAEVPVPKRRPCRRKFKPEICQKIIKLIHDGHYANTACTMAGVTESTFYRWMDQGEKDLAAGKSTAFAEFCRSIREAEAQAEARALDNILKAGNGFDVTRVIVKQVPVTDSAGKPVNGPNGRPLFTETREIVTSREFVWQAAAWYLERKYPSKYGRRVDVTSGNEPIRQPVVLVDPEKFLHGDSKQQSNGQPTSL